MCYISINRLCSLVLYVFYRPYKRYFAYSFDYLFYWNLKKAQNYGIKLFCFY